MNATQHIAPASKEHLLSSANSNCRFGKRFGNSMDRTHVTE